MKNVLVTGGLGYIGSHTIIKLIHCGYNPIIIDNLSNSKIETLDKLKKITSKNILFYNTDITNITELDIIFNKYNIWSIIHFASFKSVSESINNPLKYYKNNINSTLNILECMLKYKVKNIVFSSSCTVYGDPDVYPITELTPIKKAKSPYGETKIISEKILNNKNINTIILRYFNPIGAHESGLIYEDPIGIPENLFPYIIDVINKKQDYLKVYGNDYNTHDGTPIRDYINVNDLADAHLKSLNVIENTSYDIFNIGSGCGYSVLEIINTFKDFGIIIPYKIEDRRSGDIEKIYANIDKAINILKWKPNYTLTQSIQSIINIL